MKRSPLLETAHNALKNPNRDYTLNLLNAVNLSLREREVIIRSEIGKTDLETICNSFVHWGKKSICSYSHIVRIKREGMKKIGRYINDSKMIMMC